MNSKPIPAPIIKTPTWNWRVAMVTSIQLCEVSKHRLYFQRERDEERETLMCKYLHVLYVL